MNKRYITKGDKPKWQSETLATVTAKNKIKSVRIKHYYINIISEIKIIYCTLY